MLAWLSIQEDLNDRQRQVYLKLKELGKANDRELSDATELPINQVTPRRGELVKMGIVVEAGDKIDEKTNRRTYLWRVIG